MIKIILDKLLLAALKKRLNGYKNDEEYYKEIAIERKRSTVFAIPRVEKQIARLEAAITKRENKKVQGK